MEDISVKQCPKCGTENKGNATFCSSCGYNFVNESKPHKAKKAAILLTIATIVACAILYINAHNRKEEFFRNCALAVYDMSNGAIEAEKVCNDIVNVWNNSIYQVDNLITNDYTLDDNGYFFEDFNDALDKYTKSNVYQNHISSLRKNLTKVNEIIGKLRNSYIPSEYSQLYNEVLSLYDLYVEFYYLPITINGSLNSFSDDFNKYDSEFLNRVTKINSYFN